MKQELEAAVADALAESAAPSLELCSAVMRRVRQQDRRALPMPRAALFAAAAAVASFLLLSMGEAPMLGAPAGAPLSPGWFFLALLLAPLGAFLVGDSP